MKNGRQFIPVAIFVFLTIVLSSSCKKGDNAPGGNETASTQVPAPTQATENMEQVLLSFGTVDIIISTKTPGKMTIGRILVAESGEAGKKVLQCESMGQGTDCKLENVTFDAYNTVFGIKNMVCLDEDGGCSRNEVKYYNCTVENNLILSRKQSGAISLNCENCVPAR